MADWIDEANELSEELLKKALSKIVKYEGESSPECEECGAEIPEARQKLLPGVQTCVDCQELRERGKL
ncbi:MAG TPA: TraR/DksA family transcriptional regulator [Methanosarcina sp.]|nr:TraR/DksA family transcriptional regulator [Methanosarcina sp.]